MAACIITRFWLRIKLQAKLMSWKFGKMMMRWACILPNLGLVTFFERFSPEMLDSTVQIYDISGTRPLPI